MYKDYYINLGNLELHKTFRVNGDRRTIELVCSFNRFMNTTRFIGLTEHVAHSIVSILEWYRREFEKADADGTEEIIRHIETVIAKIGAQDYVPSEYNETEYKRHRGQRIKRGETQAVELLEYIFGVSQTVDGKPVSEPNMIEGLGLSEYCKREPVMTEGQVSKPDSLTGDIKDIPQHTNSEFNLVGVLADLNETIRKMKRKLEDLEETVHYPKTFEIEGLVKE